MFVGKPTLSRDTVVVKEAGFIAEPFLLQPIYAVRIVQGKRAILA
jgi:hypothetical protein